MKVTIQGVEFETLPAGEPYDEHGVEKMVQVAMAAEDYDELLEIVSDTPEEIKNEFIVDILEVARTIAPSE